MKIVIIGGGAAGMAAAIEAAGCGAKVTLLEKMDRVGKKLLATGNGRCNLMNVGAPCYPGGSAFAEAVLARCGAAEQTAFWQRLGLRLRTEDGGRVYPVSGQASSVLDALRLGMARLGVEIATGVTVEDIRIEQYGFTVMGGSQTWRCEKVIVAAGGCAQPKLGSDGSLWPIMKRLGHTLIKPAPALTQIVTETEDIRGLSGIRVKARVDVQRGGKTVHQEQGEVLFADYGVSGVCVMQCARFAKPGDMLRLSMTEGMGFADCGGLHEELMRRCAEWAHEPLEALLTGLCVPRLSSALMKAAGVRTKDRTISELSAGKCQAIVQVIDGLMLPVKGVKGFDSAQVTAGGLDVKEFDPASLESSLISGLYGVGEVLDVDGTCGGFNLMFAFGSGIIAGRHCVGGNV